MRERLVSRVFVGGWVACEGGSVEQDWGGVCVCEAVGRRILVGGSVGEGVFMRAGRVFGDRVERQWWWWGGVWGSG